MFSRNEKIEVPGITMGSDGKAIWLLDHERAFKRNPVFYHNLMFYFYAMPFVFSDDGIKYLETDALAFEGKSYPGIQIVYDDGVGLSAKDHYFIHYDSETFQIAWLGYTVTFGSGGKSDNIKWIRFNDWMVVDELMLPKSLTWYDDEGRTIKEARAPVYFGNVTLSESAQQADFFNIPEEAKILQ